MPIDLKWVRNHPDQVREWQIERQPQPQQDLVDLVLKSDAQARQALSTLNRQRTQLKRLQQSLRPNPKNPQPQGDRQTILTNIKQLQEHIRQLDQHWKQADQQTKTILWQLASPIDTQETPTPTHTSTTTTTTTTATKCKNQKPPKSTELLDLSTNMGLEVAQAMLQWTCRFFRDRYSVCRLPSRKNTSSWSTDMAHAVWGCTGPEKCTICHNNNEEEEEEEDSSSVANHRRPPVHLPSWLGVLKEIPSKSMFGAKQLPQYTSIWDPSNDSLEIVAMTAGTMWDSRTIQQELVQELVDFYATLLYINNPNDDDDSSTSVVVTRAIPASQLDDSIHELCRIQIVLVVKNNNNDGIHQEEWILGWVSNFGDAASRACDICYASGIKNKKEFVHLLHASVVNQETIASILQANIRTKILNDYDDDTKNTNSTREMVALSKYLKPYFDSEVFDDEKGWLWVPLKSLTVAPINSGLAPPKSTAIFRNQVGKSKFPALIIDTHFLPLKLDKQQEEQAKLAEALTSPFDFLFR